MILTYQERQNLISKLGVRLLVENGNAGAFLYTTLGVHGAKIASSPVPFSWAHNIVEYCEQSAWIEIPPLINALLSAFPLDPLIVPIGNRITGMPKPLFHQGGEPYNTCLIAMELPFLNRAFSRRALADFPLSLKPQAAGGARPARILVVNGPPGSGKSFTLNYVRYLVQVQAGSYNLAWADHDLHTNVQSGQFALAQHLADQIYPGWVIRAETKDANRPERLAQSLTQQLAAAAAKSTRENGRQRWYITLDNFYRPHVAADTHLFIRQLAAGLAGESLGWEIEDQNEGAPLRLLLLGYENALPGSGSDLVREETIGAITAGDLTAFFREYCAYKHWQAGIWPNNPAFLKGTADSLIAAAPSPDDPDRARLMGRAVMSLVAAWEEARPQKMQEGG